MIEQALASFTMSGIADAIASIAIAVAARSITADSGTLLGTAIAVGFQGKAEVVQKRGLPSSSSFESKSASPVKLLAWSVTSAILQIIFFRHQNDSQDLAKMTVKSPRTVAVKCSEECVCLTLLDALYPGLLLLLEVLLQLPGIATDSSDTEARVQSHKANAPAGRCRHQTQTRARRNAAVGMTM
jgi:hypothetical protein